jgi:hypothetical protein
MREVTLQIPEKDYSFFMRLIGKLDFVEVKSPANGDPAKTAFLDKLATSVEELNAVKSGKVAGISAKDLLNEL